MWGIALEGGGTKGAYHLGVFAALKKLGIKIDMVVGTSIGAVNAAFYAEKNLEALQKIWDEISVENILKLPSNMPKPENVFDLKNAHSFLGEVTKNKGLDISPFEKLLKENINEEKIRKSKIDFGLVTFNITDKKGLELFVEDIPEGKLVDYILASSCFPGFKLRNINNTNYLDGGLVNNLPVKMLYKKGCKNIIAVSVGGVGRTEYRNYPGYNIIQIKHSDDYVGMLDFDVEKIKKEQTLGYLDTMKAFGKLCGEEYYFTYTDYAKARRKYDVSIISGVETAASYFDIDKLKVYSFDELAYETLERAKDVPCRTDWKQILSWTDKERIVAIVNAICNNSTDIFENKIITGAIYDYYSAASALAYINMQNIQVK